MTQAHANAASADENYASASIVVPLPPKVLFRDLQDIERLFRLNPYLKIDAWQEESGPFRPGKRWHLHGLNEMNGLCLEHILTLEAVTEGRGYTVSFNQGLKRATELLLEQEGSGSRLTLKDHYHTPAGPDSEQQLEEVDRSLIPWAASIRGFLLGLDRWGWFPPYRWYRERFWLRMPPQQRRITRLVIWTTMLEFVVFLFVFAIYWLEYRPHT